MLISDLSVTSGSRVFCSTNGNVLICLFMGFSVRELKQLSNFFLHFFFLNFHGLPHRRVQCKRIKQSFVHLFFWGACLIHQMIMVK